MSINHVLNSKKTEKMVLGLAVLFCFLVHIAVLRQFTNWYSTDVVGYLSHAATFSGRDWSGVLKHASSFYSWGYSVLLTIPMLFTSNITLVYHWAVLCNALLCCGILLLCYGIGKRVFPEVNRYYVILSATAVSVYTSYTFQGAVMLSEIFLYFFVFVDIYCLLRYIETEKNIWGVLMALSVGYTYIIHNRAVAVVIAYVMIAIGWCIKEKNWKKFLMMILPLVIMLCINMGILNYLDLYEKQGTVYSANTYDSQLNRFKMFNFYAIISIAQCILGECWYALVGSFGTIGVGVYAVGKTLYRNICQKNKMLVFDVFLILMMLGTLMVSVLFIMPYSPLPEGTRSDIFIYGRYWETVLGIFILFGFLELLKKPNTNVLVSICGISVFLSVFVDRMTCLYREAIYNQWAIPALFTTYFSPEKKFSVLDSSIVGVLLMSLLFYFIKQKEKIFTLLAISVWTCFCIFTGFNAVYGIADGYKSAASVTNMPTHNVDFNAVCSFIEENEIEHFAVCAENGYRTISFQVMLPDLDVTGITNIEYWEENHGIYVIDKANWCSLDYTNIVYENESYLIFKE